MRLPNTRQDFFLNRPENIDLPSPMLTGPKAKGGKGDARSMLSGLFKKKS